MFLRVDTAIEIRAPAAAIWDFAAVPENWTASNPTEHFGLRFASADNRPGPGIEFDQHESVAGLRCKLHGRFHHFERPRRAFWSGTATYRLLGGLVRVRLPEGGVLQVDEGAVGTRVAHNVYIGFPGSLIGRLARFVFVRLRNGRQAVFDHAYRELLFFKQQVEAERRVDLRSVDQAQASRDRRGQEAHRTEGTSIHDQVQLTKADSVVTACAAAASRTTFPRGSHSIQENSMLEFEVKDMTCGHCVSQITKAVQAADPSARVETDLDKHRVRITGTLDAQAARKTIAAAGYTPTAVTAA